MPHWCALESALELPQHPNIRDAETYRNSTERETYRNRPQVHALAGQVQALSTSDAVHHTNNSGVLAQRLQGQIPNKRSETVVK